MKNTTKHIKLYFLLLITFLFSGGYVAKAQKEDVSITILETTDVHGSFFPYDLVKKRVPYGSMSQVSTYVKELREQDTLNVVLLDNGDILQGTPVVYFADYVTKDKTNPVAEMLNYMKYDAETVGNHDIEAGHKVYDNYRKELNFPLLGANAIDSVSGKSYFKPYTIIKRKGLKIAVLGLVTPSIPEWLPESLWSGMYFDDMIVSARKWVKIIKEKENPDLMVGLFHAGLNPEYGGADPTAPFNENASMLVADQVPGFDIVYSGHDHRKKVLVIQNMDSKQVLVLNAGAHAEYVARSDIRFHWDEDKKEWHKKLSGSLIKMKDIPPDSAFLKKFDYLFEGAKKYVSEEITVLSSDIKAEDALYGPSAFVDMIHEAQLELSGADISFAAPFSISAVLKKGAFTRAGLFNLYRYENFLCTIKLKGSEIKKYLEYSTDLWFDTCVNDRGTWLLLSDKDNKDDSYIKLTNAYYNFDSGAGIKYIITPDAERGSRVIIISMADGSPFDLDKTYTVALNSYRANGGGGHLTDGVGLSKEELKSRLINCTDDDFRNLLGEWLANQKQPFEPQSLDLWSVVSESK